jgi:hypothetical protein
VRALTVPADPEQLTVDGAPAAVPHHAAVEAARFAAKVVVDPRPGGCHYWVGAIGSDGYGRFQAGTGRTARTVHAHRWAYEHTCGLRPVRLRLLHSCDEPSCVNPTHLQTGTQADNVAQIPAAGRARALRAALAGGWDPTALAAAVSPATRSPASSLCCSPSRSPRRRTQAAHSQTGDGQHVTHTSPPPP